MRMKAVEADIAALKQMLIEIREKRAVVDGHSADLDDIAEAIKTSAQNITDIADQLRNLYAQ